LRKGMKQIGNAGDGQIKIIGLRYAMKVKE
jgi:hypothetical protein